MTASAAARTAGALPYNVAPEHTARAWTLLGPDKWLCVEQQVLLATDATKAHKVTRQTTAFYLPLANYRNHWKRLGFSEQDLADRDSEHFLDTMVARGDAAVLQQRIQAHFEAGASHVCIHALRADGQPMPDWHALAALAPQ
jgi:probable F420-dependent oxidoreductase